MKETYKVKRPERLVFGDPLYFKEYEGELLKKLTVDITPPDHFSARVTLEEAPVKGCPGLIGRVMTIYLAPERTMQTYLQGMMYESQDMLERRLPVDTAEYYLKVDDRDEVIHTGGDGYWGAYVEYSRMIHGKEYLDAAVVAIVMPDDTDMDEMRRYLIYFFRDVQQVENPVMPEPIEEQDEPDCEDCSGQEMN